MIQHRDWRRCAIGALCTFLFYRWEILGEPFPDTQWRLPKNEYPDWAPFEGTEEEYEVLLRQDPASRTNEPSNFDFSDGPSNESRPEPMSAAEAEAAAELGGGTGLERVETPDPKLPPNPQTV